MIGGDEGREAEAPVDGDVEEVHGGCENAIVYVRVGWGKGRCSGEVIDYCGCEEGG